MEEALDLEPCHSDASSTSNQSFTRTRSYLIGVEEGAGHETATPRVFVDLTHDEPTSPSSSLELKLAGCRESNYLELLASKTFACKFCGREFLTAQALGGHQNAHTQERTAVKHRHKMAAAPTRLHGLPYHPYIANSIHGVFNRSIGVRAESMIRKPYPHYNRTLARRLTLEKLSRAYLIRPSPSMQVGGSLNLRGNPNPAAVNDRAADNGHRRLRLRVHGSTNLGGNTNSTAIDSGHQWLGLRVGRGSGDQHDDAEEPDLELRL
ncbi:hypothetical protein AAHA92_04496 [Salvia divinorum]|uniref:C2H2-type domain-containing protein n=1 Tax=Salvia divinorum TaxID=28513 RepID=A0ABD1HZD5_SALDI